VPWKETCHVSERLSFMKRLEQGDRMTDVCREFGVSRKTGYKLWARYQRLGAVGLFDESRRPERSPQRVTGEVETVVLQARQAHPTWGPRKLHAWLSGQHPSVRLPSPSTIGDVLKRNGVVMSRRKRRRTPLHEAPLESALQANDLWCADFKGQFRLGNRNYCYPLTITDQFSRFLLTCEGLESTETEPARKVFELTFREFGLPSTLRTDNGVPFASRGLAGLSRLSVWWLRLGIVPERIEPAHPEQNGRHERMHLTLKQETTRPPAHSLLQQQERFERFIDEYNNERPHEALGQRPPTTLYTSSVRPFPNRLPEPEYPFHDDVLTVSKGGHVRLGRRRRDPQFFLANALRGQRVGVREVDDGVWLISFVSLDLGHFDGRANQFFEGAYEPHAET